MKSIWNLHYGEDFHGFPSATGMMTPAGPEVLNPCRWVYWIPPLPLEFRPSEGQLSDSHPLWIRVRRSEIQYDSVWNSQTMDLVYSNWSGPALFFLRLPSGYLT